MRMKSYLTVAFREFKFSLKTFALYFIILVCLESISVSILKAATDTPDKIEVLADDLGSNCISIECSEISDIETLADKDDIKINYVRSNMPESIISNILGYENYSKLNLLNYREGIICSESKFENNATSYLQKHMISGSLISDTTKDYMWISDDISHQLQINVGDLLKNPDSDLGSTTFEVAGIYTASKDICSIFVTEATYEKTRNLLQYNDAEKLVLWVKCNDYKSIGKFKNKLSENHFTYAYNEELYSAINMMYASFYAAVVVLSVALTGIVIYLSELYYNKRRSFFSLNYIIGMSQKDIIYIIFILIGILLSFSLIISGCISMLIMGYFDDYLFKLFNIDFNLRGFPFVQFLIYCVIMCLCLLIVLIRIKKIIGKSFTIDSGRNL